MNTPPYGAPWQHVFVHAMMEIDSPSIASKIAAAEDAISKRLDELPLDKANAEELRALLSAIIKLDRAKTELDRAQSESVEKHSSHYGHIV